MLEFRYMEPGQFERYGREIFSILAENMSQIAPTGNDYETDYRNWRGSMECALQDRERHVVLLLEEDNLIGYFQYAVVGTAFRMEEIQLRSDYQGAGQVFRQLYRFVIPKLPGTCQFVEASARKENLKSNGILTHMGLQLAGENLSGSSNRYRGTMYDLKVWLETRK